MFLSPDCTKSCSALRRTRHHLLGCSTVTKNSSLFSNRYCRVMCFDSIREAMAWTVLLWLNEIGIILAEAFRFSERAVRIPSRLNRRAKVTWTRSVAGQQTRATRQDPMNWFCFLRKPGCASHRGAFAGQGWVYRVPPIAS